GLGVDARLLPSVDGGQDDAGSVLVEHRARDGQPPADILERVVAEERDPANAPLDLELLTPVGAVQGANGLLESFDLPEECTDRIVAGEDACRLTAPRRGGEHDEADR